jgi:hypothetical protein
LLFVVLGLLLFYFVGIFFASYSLVAALVSAWIVAGLICTGVFLALNASLRRSSKSLLAVFVVLVAWSMILLLRLPSNFQIFLASFTSFAFVLLYWYYKKKPSILWLSFSKNKRLSKIVGILLVVPGFVLFFSLAGVAEAFNMFTAWLVSLPLCLDVMVGFQLMRGKRLKEAIVGWFGYIILTLIPFVVVLPTVYHLPIEYQILTLTLTPTVIILGLYSYRQQYRQRIRSTKRRSGE